MKSFLEEYGFAILAAIVVIVLILMASPVGKAIKASLLGVVNEFTNTATEGVGSASEKIEGIANEID